MGLHKGMTNNPNGRKKGTPNRSSAEIKTAFKSLLDANIEQLEKDLKALPPKERIHVLLKLADFILPKIQSVQSDTLETDNVIIIERI